MLRKPALLAALSLASCMHAAGSSPSGLLPAHPMRTCYVTTIAPAAVKATITFYGWPDNYPPGNSIAHPVIHRVASGAGTYCNPTTFATEPSMDKEIPYGIKIYVPFLKQYFIREDDCTTSGSSTGSGSNGCYGLWFDLWIGGNARSDVNALVACERKLTPNAKVRVVLYPGPNEPVAFPGPLYRNQPAPYGTCDGRPASAGGLRRYAARA
jgi:hypothetical protein